MEGLSGVREISETEGKNLDDKPTFNKQTLDKYDKILGDDKLESKNTLDENRTLSVAEREDKYKKLFDVGDLFKNNENIAITDEKELDEKKADLKKNGSVGFSEKREENSEYELETEVYETDDNGVTYKKNGELLPNVEYSENDHTYQTDENGRIKSCDGNPKYTEEGNRNTKEQKESGGDERLEDDDGGHIIAKILNGPEGAENLVPMRRTINRGDYKKMENEIAKSLQEGKKVLMHIDIAYEGDSQRPSKISVEYNIDEKKTVIEFDNKENSTELFETLEEKNNDKNYQNLKDEIEDMKADGVEASVTSVKTEYGKDGEATRITVGILEETTGKKTYKVYEPR